MRRSISQSCSIITIRIPREITIIMIVCTFRLTEDLAGADARQKEATDEIFKKLIIEYELAKDREASDFRLDFFFGFHYQSTCLV